MSQPKSIDYQIHFAAALVAALLMWAAGSWSLESGFRIAALLAWGTFALAILYAVIAWVLAAQARLKAKREGSRDSANH
ncbi:hypothetical protein GCM10027430_35970 [Lysobacter tyrosinilyticus]